MSIVLMHDLCQALRLVGLDSDEKIEGFLANVPMALASARDGSGFRAALLQSAEDNGLRPENHVLMNSVLAAVYEKHKATVDGMFEEGAFAEIKPEALFSERIVGGGVFVGLAMGALAGAAILACIKYCDQLVSKSD
jgi:hypothetical protein